MGDQDDEGAREDVGVEGKMGWRNGFGSGTCKKSDPWTSWCFRLRVGAGWTLEHKKLGK